MSSDALVRAAGLILYRRLGGQLQYLLMQTSYGHHHWTPPKGHVDPGEDYMQAALRETQEEAGLKLQEHYDIDLNFKKELRYNVRGKPKIVVYWLAALRNQFTADNDPVRLSREHQDFKWLPLKEAAELVGYKDFVLLLQECEQYLQGSGV